MGGGQEGKTMTFTVMVDVVGVQADSPDDAIQKVAAVLLEHHWISTSTPRSRQITEYPEPEEFPERIWLSLNGHGPVLLTGSLRETNRESAN
jgi:hypothetical protein